MDISGGTSALSHHFDRRLHWAKQRCRLALALPLILLAVGFGQTSDRGFVAYLTTLSSGIDVMGSRTPCERVRDLVDPSKAAQDVAGDSPMECDKVIDIIAGPADPPEQKPFVPIQSGGVAVDSKFRVLITEPTTKMVHVFDFATRRYWKLQVAKDDRMQSPYALATDGNNNIYITDLARGRIAVYGANGTFLRYMGNFKDEGLFEKPESIAIDPATGHIFVADSERGFVVILDADGQIFAEIGKRGGGDGPAEFREPTAIAIDKQNLFVFDKYKNRIQILDLEGHFQKQFTLDDVKKRVVHGIAVDAQGRLFVSVGYRVEVFDQAGKSLLEIGPDRDEQREILKAGGICIDARNRAYVIDTLGRRIQVFQVTTMQ
jgi:sugar lactone lactonase YvrE